VPIKPKTTQKNFLAENIRKAAETKMKKKKTFSDEENDYSEEQ
jgi:hypothetical protein